jgi:3-phenylpropionate/trans-cinnamate dioxygenase ferredoxin component
MENSVECPKHASIFDFRTGKVATLPACYNLQCSKTRVADGRVMIEV